MQRGDTLESMLSMHIHVCFPEGGDSILKHLLLGALASDATRQLMNFFLPGPGPYYTPSFSVMYLLNKSESLKARVLASMLVSSVWGYISVIIMEGVVIL